MSNLFEQDAQPQDQSTANGVPPIRRKFRRTGRTIVTQPSNPSIRYIGVTQGQYAVVSTRDYEYLMQWLWYARWDPKVKTFYAVRKETAYSKPILMHQVIFGACDRVDHVDGNGLHNWRENLRESSRAENAWNAKLYPTNTSGFKGVHQRKDTGAWVARVWCNKITYYVGEFPTREEANEARIAKAKELHGKFYRER